MFEDSLKDLEKNKEQSRHSVVNTPPPFQPAALSSADQTHPRTTERKDDGLVDD